MGVAETAGLGAEFLEHYGVRGMRWGVRRAESHAKTAAKARSEAASRGDRKLTTKGGSSRATRRLESRAQAHEAKSEKIMNKLDKRWEKKANGIDSFIEIHNGAGDEYNNHIGSINKKYEGIDLTKHENREKRDAYNREVEDLMRRAYQNSASRIKSPSGKQQLTLDFKDDDSFSIRAKKVQHADDGVTGHFIRDKKGFVIGITFDFLEHGLIEAGEEFLEHYGVLGMRWGVRRNTASRDKIQTRMATKESARREARPVSVVRAQDTIGRNRLTKTKIHTAGGEDHPATEDAVRVAKTKQKLKTSGVHSLSNEEIQDVIRRTNLEKQLKEASRHKYKTPTQEFIDALLEDPKGKN